MRNTVATICHGFPSSNNTLARTWQHNTCNSRKGIFVHQRGRTAVHASCAHRLSIRNHTMRIMRLSSADCHRTGTHGHGRSSQGLAYYSQKVST